MPMSATVSSTGIEVIDVVRAELLSVLDSHEFLDGQRPTTCRTAATRIIRIPSG